MWRPRITAALWVAAAIIFTAWSVSASAQHIFAPGEVDKVHGKQINKCSACHDALKGSPDAKCLKCHKKIIAEVKHGLTIHADTDAACARCHRIHGNTLTASLLSPSAVTLASVVHNGSRFCVECHKGPDNHYGPACDRCHKVDTWKGPTFKHQPLPHHSQDAFHCSSCHPRGYKSFSCSGCHNGRGDRDRDQGRERTHRRFRW